MMRQEAERRAHLFCARAIEDKLARQADEELKVTQAIRDLKNWHDRKASALERSVMLREKRCIMPKDEKPDTWSWKREEK
jgi:hypothetical protein